MKSSNTLYKVGIVFSILHTRELQLRRAKYQVPGHKN